MILKRLLPFFFILVCTQSAAEIPAYYQRISALKEVPAPLIYAIAMQESRPPHGLIAGVNKPWPWTLNCEGRGYFFPSREAAFNVATQFINSGESCDVGLMQVSWKYHKNRFSSLNNALDPYTNIEAGADYLKEQYEKSGSWEIAVGKYHNPSDPVKADFYRERVRNHLVQILGVSF
jgi:hypothetical protein